MPIEFTYLHNLVRTYQRSLNLQDSDRPMESRSTVRQDDRVSISSKAREEREHLSETDDETATDQST